MAKGAPKGHRPYNTKGRPGARNVRSLEWEEFGKRLLEVGLPRAMVIMETSEDSRFMDDFTKLLEYFKPKLARSELTGKNGVDLIPKPIMDVIRTDHSKPENRAFEGKA